MSKCDRCGLRRKTESMSGFPKQFLAGMPEMQDKSSCNACKNHVLHVSACNQTNQPAFRPDYLFLKDKRYKHDITKIEGK